MKKNLISLTLLLLLFSINSIAQEKSVFSQAVKSAKFELLKLPYETNELEPVISQKTIELHHGKHLQGYVNNLNKLIVGTKFEGMSLEDIVCKSDGGIFNNAGQILNHNLYFTQFSPKGGDVPSGKLADAINKSFGSFENFQKEFETAGTSLFGSGWVWLAKEKDGTLIIVKEANGSNPVTKNLVPILGFDVWEHAYYLDYQNKRADHIKALWKIIDWSAVEKRY